MDAQLDRKKDRHFLPGETYRVVRKNVFNFAMMLYCLTIKFN